MSDPRSLGSGYIRNVPFLPLVHYCVVIYRGVHSCDSLGAYTGGWPRGPGVLVEVGRWRSSRMRWSGMCTLVVEWMVHHSLVMEMGWVTNLLDGRSLTMEMSRYRDPRSVLLKQMEPPQLSVPYITHYAYSGTRCSIWHTRCGSR